MESAGEKAAASEVLRKFPPSTWHGGEGAHRAKTMAPNLAFSGREVGRFFILPDRSNAGETTRDTSFCNFLGVDDSSGRGCMGGALHSDWLCDEKAIGFEGRHILSFKFTFTPELSTRPILSDTYKRLPTLATQKLRKPHIDLVFGGTSGRRLRFLETNFVPKMLQRDYEVESLVKRTSRTRLSNKRTFTWSANEVGEASGIFQMQSASHLREYVLAPSVRRAFFRYWVTPRRDFSIKAREETTQDLRLIDSAFGSSLQSDAESLCAQKLGGGDRGQKEIYESDAPVPPNEVPMEGRNRGKELQHSVELLRRVRRAAASDTNVRAYKICALPDTVRPGIRALRSSKNKQPKMRNFATALYSFCL